MSHNGYIGTFCVSRQNSDSFKNKIFFHFLVGAFAVNTKD